jgi:tetratricopeptide (TPR) repeat protein
LLDPLLADPHPAVRAAAWIADPPVPVAAGSWQLWVAITRIAERGGHWGTAVDGWLRIAAMRDADGELRATVNASIAAGIDRDQDRADELLERARAKDPDHPKVRLQDVGKMQEPAEQLEALAGLESENEDEQALIELNRALAHVQMDAFDEAERALRRAEQYGAARLTQLPVVRANLAVQRNRINAGRGHPIDGRALEAAQRECLAARETLIGEHRFAESVRALMLAVDAVAMRTDFAGAETLLQLATEDEIAAEDGSGVLGDAALRCMVPRLALRFTERADDSPERRRIRAAASLRLRQNIEANRAELRALALGHSDEAGMAAFAYSRDAAFHRGTWDAEVGAVLSAVSPIEAVTLEAWYLARSMRYDEARTLLARHEPAHWALQLLFTLADLADHPDALELVPRVLASNPDRHQRLRCAAVLLRDGQSARAEDAARQVAQDESAPIAERSDGYDQLVQVLAADKRWRDAHFELAGWARVDATDERLNAWQVRVGNRLSRRED